MLRSMSRRQSSPFGDRFAKLCVLLSIVIVQIGLLFLQMLLLFLDELVVVVICLILTVAIVAGVFGANVLWLLVGDC